MATISTLNQTQLNIIEAYATAGNYPAMYNYIATGIANGSISVPGGTSSNIYFWYSQAGAINANDTSTPSTAFIRDVAMRGLQYDGKDSSASAINTVSDAIAQNVASEIHDAGGLPDFVTQLSEDIGTSLKVGQITLGGWGGSFYHWNDIYRDKTTGEEKTVGEWIMSTPGELQKFIAVNSQAVADNAQQFPGLTGEDSFWASIKKVVENVISDPLGNGFDAAIAYNQVIGRAVIELNIRGYSAIGDFLAKQFRDLEWAVYTGINEAGYAITGDVNKRVTDALNWVPPRRDPLVLDLDGGGITTSGINTGAPILFDQDGDGILTATGWIAPGEAIVVRDLNGNGTIDSGRELFGDNTILTHGPRAGQTAAHGFEALADLDALVQSWGHTSAMQTSVQLGSLRGGDASKNVTGRARITWTDGQFGYGVFRKGCLLRRIRLVASSSNSAGVTSSAEHKRNRADRLDWFAATSSRATYVRPTSARWASSSCEISKACRRALTAAENA